jgi:4-hydroxymandelate oxidase
VGKLENQWRRSVSRRNALGGLAGVLAGSPFLGAQQDTFRDHSRVPAMDELVTAFDFEPVCYAKVPRSAYDYTALGSENEFTLRRNREAFDWVDIIPRAVVDVSSVNTSTEVLGIRMDYPIMIAPSAGHGQLHPEGEMAMHQGATAAKTPMIVSTVSSFPIDKIGAAATGPLWFQLYSENTEEGNRELVENAVAAGCKAVALTVDTQLNSYRERTLHDRHLAAPPAGGGRGGRRRNPLTAAPPNPYHLNFQTPWNDYKIIDQLRKFTKVPILLKGILTGEDAKTAVERGIDAIIVSNHGGRQLDYAPSTLEVLPEIVEAVNGRIPVLVDSGFRRGSDMLKALALGAKAVCLGRVPRWGLGAYGSPGVQRIVEILQAELVLAMAQAGRPNLDSLDRTAVRTNFV